MKVDWGFSFKTGSNNELERVIVDKHGNSFVLGNFRDSVTIYDINDSLTMYSASSGDYDSYIVKYNQKGEIIWNVHLQRPDDNRYRKLYIDDSSNIYYSGTIGTLTDLNPYAGIDNYIPRENWDFFITKLDSNGNYIKSYTLRSSGAFGAGSFTDMKQTSDGGFVATGGFEDTCDFDPGPGITDIVSPEDGSYFLAKYDHNFNLLWVNVAGGNNTQYGEEIIIDEFDNIYVGGNFRDTFDIDHSSGIMMMESAHFQNSFVAKYSSSGDFLWANMLGVIGATWFGEFHFDSAGDLYYTYSFQDLALDNNGCLEKTSPAGSMIWTNSYKSATVSPLFEITADNKIYFTGNFQGVVDVDPGAGVVNVSTNPWWYDFFVQEFDINGNLQWTKQFGSTETDMTWDMDLGLYDEIFLLGEFKNNVDFDPDTSNHILSTSGTQTNGFLIRYMDCVSSLDSVSLSGCKPFLSPSGNFVWTNSGIYYDTLYSTKGCDSILRIDLTIIPSGIDTSVANSINTLIANQGGAQYQWLDCNNSMMEMLNDTNQILTPLSSGNFAVEITQNGCVDTSACYSIFNVGIIHNEIGAELLLYPNPTDGNFSLDLGSIQTAVTITIMDINSRLILSNSYKDRQLLSLKLEEPAGVYMVIVESGENKAVIRLVKE